MSKFRIYLFFSFIFFASGLFAQASYLVSGKVVDAATQEPLAFSAVMLKGTLLSTETNAAGEFTITTTDKNRTLVVFQYGYTTLEYIVPHGDQQGMVIELKMKSYNLAEIVVTNKRVDTLQANNHTWFLAFEFYDNFIVALVNKGKRYHMIQLLDESGKVIQEHKAPIGVEELFKDCLGNVQLLSKDSSYQFYYNYENITLLKPYAIGIFYATLRPCQCIVGNNYYFKEITYKSLRNTYYLINRQDLQKKKLFTQVVNDEVISAFNANYDINYFLSLRRKGGSYAISVDEMKSRIEELRENLSLTLDEQFMLKPVRSDLLKLDSLMLVVDYTHKVLYRHNFLGGLLGTDSLNLKGASPFVVQDTDRKRVYFVKEVNGEMSLYEYRNPFNTSKPLVVEGFRFMKNVRCRNGTLYFLNKNPADPVAKICTYRL